MLGRPHDVQPRCSRSSRHLIRRDDGVARRGRHRVAFKTSAGATSPDGTRPVNGRQRCVPRSRRRRRSRGPRAAERRGLRKVAGALARKLKDRARAARGWAKGSAAERRPCDANDGRGSLARGRWTCACRRDGRVSSYMACQAHFSDRNAGFSSSGSGPSTLAAPSFLIWAATTRLLRH